MSRTNQTNSLRITTAERAARVRFRRAMSLMLMTLVLPGSAQLLAGNPRVGRVALRIWIVTVLAVVLAVAVALVHRPIAFSLATNTVVLLALRLGLTVAAVGWAVLFFDAWRLGRPLSLQLQHRRVAIGVNGVLSLSVAAVLLFSAHIVGVQHGLMQQMFGSGAASAANHGRYNVLLLGGDAGSGRWGLRADSINVASIDQETGKAVLISLPRNMQNFPFRSGSVLDEEFPDGFDCEECYLNGVSTWAQDHPDLFGDAEYPGVEATTMAVEGITGLDINYWAMVNLDGFKDLVDAVGGVTLNVRDPIPIGLPSDDFYDHIEPGTRKLSGFETLWYARARHDSDDYSRMARQKCVMGAMLDQVSPQSALRNFSRIADASSQMVATDLPGSEVDTFLDLALKAKSQKIGTVSLVPPKINTADPDIDTVHRMVERAIAKAEGRSPEATASSGSDDSGGSGGSGNSGGSGGGGEEKSAPTTSTGGSLGSLKEGYAANQAEDLDSAC